MRFSLQVIRSSTHPAPRSPLYTLPSDPSTATHSPTPYPGSPTRDPRKGLPSSSPYLGSLHYAKDRLGVFNAAGTLNRAVATFQDRQSGASPANICSSETGAVNVAPTNIIEPRRNVERPFGVKDEGREGSESS